MIDVSVLNCSVARRTIVVAIVIASVVAREDTKVPSVGVIAITIEIGAENVGVVSALKIVVAVGIVVVTIEIAIVSIEVVVVTIIEIAVVVIVVVAIVVIIVIVVAIGKSHCHALETGCNVMALGGRTVPSVNIRE